MLILGLIDSGACYPECMSAVDAFHATISENDIPRCQDLQDVALCSLAQAIDTGKALAADDVIEVREIYESDHPILCPGLVCIVNVALGRTVPRRIGCLVFPDFWFNLAE